MWYIYENTKFISGFLQDISTPIEHLVQKVNLQKKHIALHLKLVHFVHCVAESY